MIVVVISHIPFCHPDVMRVVFMGIQNPAIFLNEILEAAVILFSGQTFRETDYQHDCQYLGMLLKTVHHAFSDPVKNIRSVAGI